MRKFLWKLLVFAGIVVAGIVTIFCILDAAGWSDHNYKRFTSKGEKSMILGTSRAAQGIVPCVIDTCLFGCGYELPVYNFAFNIGESPFGEIYYSRIEKKIGTNPEGNSLFIVAVDPYALSEEESDKGMREARRTLDRVHFFFRPNLEYMFRYCHPHEWRPSRQQILHDDGWLEISVPIDSVSMADGVRRKIEDYNSYHITKSDYRMHWLAETVGLLKENGSVFLCRIPVSREMSGWEDRMWPDFDADMQSFAAAHGVRYLPFVASRNIYRTTDGNHLYKDDGRLFTRELCDSLKVR